MANQKIIIHYHHIFSKHANRFKSKRKSIESAIGLFQKNIYSPRLKTHKLEGELKNYWSFSVDYHLRILFKFVASNTVLFLDIGTHEIYH